MESPQKAQALGERFMTLHHELRRDTAQLATDAIEKTLGR
jgi:lipid-A-disaccharide synthase